jgi:chromosome segregation ATPase
MRTSYNGSYGASLLFSVKDGSYFVALFQQKAFWRVIKTYDETRAEAIYRDFSRQAERLAVNELRAAKLESQKAQMDRQIEVAQERARRLQADISIAREQQVAVADRQKNVRNETAALQAQQAELQSQLRALQQRVRSLQREADAGLPTTAR